MTTQRVSLLLLLVWLALGEPAAIAQSETQPEIQIDAVSVDEINLDFVRLAIDVSVVSEMRVDVRELVLENLKLNGMPVYALPFIGRWNVPSNVRSAIPKPVVVTIYLRDVDSTGPLEELLSRNRIVVEGSARIKLNLGLIQKFFLLSKTATVPVAFRKEVPFRVPAPGSMREAAAILVGLGSPILGGARSGLDLARDLASRCPGGVRTYGRTMHRSSCTFGPVTASGTAMARVCA
jgi:hypothetical protein